MVSNGRNQTPHDLIKVDGNMLERDVAMAILREKNHAKADNQLLDQQYPRPCAEYFNRRVIQPGPTLLHEWHSCVVARNELTAYGVTNHVHRTEEVRVAKVDSRKGGFIEQSDPNAIESPNK
jgi:hypothetical protein